MINYLYLNKNIIYRDLDENLSVSKYFISFL